jgi:hypothetical protein
MNKTILTISALLMLTVAGVASRWPATERSGSALEVSAVAGLVNQDAAATHMTTANEDTDLGGLNTSYENAVSIELQLLLGTLSLDDDLAVTSEQASELLPLWSELKEISMSAGPGQGPPPQDEDNATPQPPAADAETQEEIDALVEQVVDGMTSEQIDAIVAMEITRDSAMTIMQELGITPGGNGAPPDGGGPMGGPPGGGMIPSELFDALIKALGGDPAATTS